MYVRFPTLPLFYRFCNRPIASSPLCSRERRYHPALPFQRIIYIKLEANTLEFLSLRCGNYDAGLEGTRRCQVANHSIRNIPLRIRKLGMIVELAFVRLLYSILALVMLRFTMSYLWCSLCYIKYKMSLRRGKIYHSTGT